jgi:hypothetical protein
VNAAQRRSIAIDYWVSIGLAVAVLVNGSWMHGWGEPGLVTYFGATFLIIHAHGRRIRNTILALHEEGAK